jgi:hypothetical protein
MAKPLKSILTDAERKEFRIALATINSTPHREFTVDGEVEAWFRKNFIRLLKPETFRRMQLDLELRNIQEEMEKMRVYLEVRNIQEEMRVAYETPSSKQNTKQ